MNRSVSLTVGCILVVSLLGAKASGQNIVVQQVDSRTELSLEDGQSFRTTEGRVTDARLIGVSGSTPLIALWNESR